MLFLVRILIQRTTEASVTVGSRVTGQIGLGLVILLGVEAMDEVEDAQWLAGKVSRMRIFPDAEGLMNQSLMDVGGQALVISQFTLHADTKKGNRPSFIRAARPEQAIPLYEKFVAMLSELLGKEVATGEFGADMKVALINDGPVTIWMDSKNRE